MDPIQPITPRIDPIPPVTPAARGERINDRRRDRGRPQDEEPAERDERDDEDENGDGRPHVDVSA